MATTSPSDQRLAALERANEIRTRRAHLKRDLQAGRVHIEDLLVNPPEWCDTAKVGALLIHVPKYGRVKINRLLMRCRISPSRTIGGLSPRQREELASQLSRKANGRPEGRPLRVYPEVGPREEHNRNG